MDWAASAIELIWVGGLAALPMALLVAAISRRSWCRPATRHALWAAVLATLVGPLLTWPLGRMSLFRSDRVLAYADSLATRLHPTSGPDTTTSTAASGLPASSPTLKATDAAPAFSRSTTPSLAPATSARAPIPLRERPAMSALARQLTSTNSQRYATSPRSAAPAYVAPTRALSRLAQSLTAQAPSRYSVSPRDAAPPSMSCAAAESTPRGSHAAGKPAVVSAPASSPTAAGTPALLTQDDLAFQDARAWAVRALAARDAMAAVPPVPSEIWLAGVLVMSVLIVCRFFTARRVISHAVEAPDDIRAIVARCAERAGLAHPPQTLVSDRRISPMITCGLRPRLILPADLWRELDVESRHAVVLHEMAHLRRLDHRLRWLESIVGVLYWWHPIVWWARRRLRDEAELCCDAWVTSLIPERRRAYAEALITTKSFLSVPGTSGTPGLAVMSSRTRHLARRLTMVMTQRVAPKSSILGVALALSVALAGAFVMPSLACPPTEEEKAAQAEKTAAKSAGKAAEKAHKAKAAKAPKATSSKAEAGFLGEAPALEAMRATEENRARAADDRTRTMEAERRAYESAARAGQQQSRNAEAQRRAAEQSARAAVRAQELGAAAQRRGAEAQKRAMENQARAAENRARARGGVSVTAPAQQNAATEPREYRLSDGKREALTELMAREDVPILIERHDDKIVVHATPTQHKVFEAFINLIEPDTAKNDDAGERGKDESRHDYNEGHEHAEGHEHVDAINRHLSNALGAVTTRNGQLAASLDALRANIAGLTTTNPFIVDGLTIARVDGVADDDATETDEHAAEEAKEEWTDRLEELTGHLDELEEAAVNLAEQLEAVTERIESLAGRPRSAAPTIAMPGAPMVAALAVPPAAPTPAAAPMPALAPTPAVLPTPFAPPAPAVAPSPAAAPQPAMPPAPPSASTQPAPRAGSR
ncbi:MAG: M56 family metallopeptidase [Phycisphaerales bacterium]